MNKIELDQFSSACERNDTKNKLKQLQFLRFMAFMMIFLLHTNLWSSYVVPVSIEGRYAALAVSFFVVLSGFLTGWNSSRTKDFSLNGLLKNALKRLRRIYPHYLITTVISVLWSAF